MEAEKHKYLLVMLKNSFVIVNGCGCKWFIKEKKMFVILPSWQPRLPRFTTRSGENDHDNFSIFTAFVAFHNMSFIVFFFPLFEPPSALFVVHGTKTGMLIGKVPDMEGGSYFLKSINCLFIPNFPSMVHLC